MRVIKKEILNLFLIIIVINIVAILILGFIEVQMIYALLQERSSIIDILKSNPYVDMSFLFSDNSSEYQKMFLQLITPIIVYFCFFLISIIAFVYKIGNIIKSLDTFSENTKNNLEELKIDTEGYEYEELNNINNIVNDAVMKIKKNNLLEKEIINSTMHDIKTPLHIIEGYNQILAIDSKDKLLNNKIREQLVEINEIIEYMLSDERKLLFKKTNIMFMIDEIKESYISVYEDIIFKIKRLDNNINWEVDKVSFRRILINLIDNAIEASDNNIIEIEVSATYLSIQNSGRLLTKEAYLGYVNEEEINNKGLGLKIINRYCELNNILLKIDNTDNKTKVILEVKINN